MVSFKTIKLLLILITCQIFYLLSIILPSEAFAQTGWIDLVVDKNIYLVPDLPKPKYLEPITDPTFGSKITRVTGDPGTPIVDKNKDTIGTWGTVVRHHYSKDQPWNADESLLHISRNNQGSPSSIFLNGQTYEVEFARSVPGHDNRWHPIIPDIKVYVSSNRLGYFNVRTGQDQSIDTFSEYTRIDLGPYEGNISHDGKMVVFYATKTNGDHDVFAYDLESKTKYPVKNLGPVNIDWASVSASGRYVVIMYNDTDTQVFDLDMNFVSKFTSNHNHYDLGFDLDGKDSASGICKSPPYNGHIIEHRLENAQFAELTKGGYAIHTSMRNNLRPGWSYSSTHDTSSYPPYRDELIAVKTDGSLITQRICHLHNVQTDYLAESQPVPNHDGSRVFFASNWGDPSGRPVSGYVVDVRNQTNSEPPLACPGDLNNDRVVNLADLSLPLSNWGKTGIGDLNADGVVNLADIAYILSKWGSCQ